MRGAPVTRGSRPSEGLTASATRPVRSGARERASDSNPLPPEMTATCCQSGEVERVNGRVQGLSAEASEASWSRQASHRECGSFSFCSMAKKAVSKSAGRWCLRCAEG